MKLKVRIFILIFLPHLITSIPEMHENRNKINLGVH